MKTLPALKVTPWCWHARATLALRATFSVRPNISSGDGGQNLECNEQRGGRDRGENEGHPCSKIMCMGADSEAPVTMDLFCKEYACGLETGAN